MTYDICIKIIMAPILRKKKRKILALLRGCSCFYFILLVLILGILSMNISSAAYAFQPSNLSPINESKRQLSIRRIPFKSLFVHPSGRTLIRLFDSERSEAGLQLAHNMGGGVTGNPSLMDGITVESFKVKDATFEINTLEHMSDVPTRTKNGGYTHTRASRAKISAANKGKTPWNKGKARSKETCARIAAGVRAKNRERFLQKLKDLNMTEEEYEEQKKAERNKKQAETRARKTEKGGYRPTKETRKKISNILKKKWANGELKKKRIDKTKARRGFTHSEETRKKISDSLRKRWSEDRSYREEMTEKTTIANTSEVTRRRISETLKAKWQDPEFRSMMMEKMKTRKPPSGNSRGKSYREKISEAMKAKWQEKEYRERTVSSIRRNALEAAKRRRIKTKTSLTKQAVSQKKRSKISHFGRTSNSNKGS